VITDCDQFEGRTLVNLSAAPGAESFTIVSNSLEFVIPGNAGPIPPCLAPTATGCPGTVALFLHGGGPAAAPNFLDAVAPLTTTVRFVDSRAVNFAGGNLWQEVAVWTAAPVESPRTVAVLGALRAWIGLINSDDQGARFDVRAELRKNGTTIASGETRCVTGVLRPPDRAKEVNVPLALPSSHTVETGDVLSIAILARIGTTAAGARCGNTSSAGGLRVYFDALERPAGLELTFE
jgi:hypothetical protein